MTITLYHTTSDINVVNKIFDTENSITINFKNIEDIDNPVITLTLDNNINNYNYFYLPTLKRYYFITKIEIINNNIYKITGHIDVLMSFKDKFLPLKAIIKRNENSFNSYLDDNYYKTVSYSRVQTKKFNKELNGTGYVLITAGGV